MRLLLDTHVILWSVREPERLRAPVAEALEDAENELWYTPISVWEVLILSERKRLPRFGSIGRHDIDELFEEFQEAPLNKHVAIASRTIELPHADPADRFIAATALVYDLTLVTEDRNLARTPGISVFR